MIWSHPYFEKQPYVIVRISVYREIHIQTYLIMCRCANVYEYKKICIFANSAALNLSFWQTLFFNQHISVTSSGTMTTENLQWPSCFWSCIWTRKKTTQASFRSGPCLVWKSLDVVGDAILLPLRLDHAEFSPVSSRDVQLHNLRRFTNEWFLITYLPSWLGLYTLIWSHICTSICVCLDLLVHTPFGVSTHAYNISLLAAYWFQSWVSFAAQVCSRLEYSWWSLLISAIPVLSYTRG